MPLERHSRARWRRTDERAITGIIQSLVVDGNDEGIVVTGSGRRAWNGLHHRRWMRSTRRGTIAASRARSSVDRAADFGLSRPKRCGTERWDSEGKASSYLLCFQLLRTDRDFQGSNGECDSRRAFCHPKSRRHRGPSDASLYS